ncbi:MAG: P-II family nitrogen regulator [Bacillota bacterium]|nr:P-II family nitrogen regulator [Bacillota bacterium]
MKKLEIITRSEKLEELKKTLNDIGINGMTVSTVMGCGNQKGRTEFYRGTEVTINLLHKIKVEIVISDSDLEKVLKSVRDSLVTGNIGDGKIFIFNVEDAIRIRTGENGDQAIKVK